MQAGSAIVIIPYNQSLRYFRSTGLVNINITFPTALMQLSDLEELRLYKCGLYGELPDLFSSFTELVSLDLSVNQLSGRIPKSISTLQTLDTLILEQNEFEGPIPAELGELVDISTILLAFNLLTGDIPVSFANLRNISTLGLDRNILSGKVPDFVTGLGNLRDLRLQGNYLTGPVPNSWRWGSRLDGNCIEESDGTESNLTSILKRQRTPGECSAFYNTNSQITAISQPRTSTAASLPFPAQPTTVNTTVLAVSIATSLLVVFTLSVALYAVRRRRQIDDRPFFSFFSKSSSIDLEPRFTSHPIIVQPVNEKGSSTLFANLEVVESRTPPADIVFYEMRGLSKSEMDPAPTVGRSSTLMGKSNGSVASVGRSGTVATSSAWDSATEEGDYNDEIIEHDSMARDPEDWSRKEVISWLAKCGFRPAVIEVFGAHEITGALLMEVTEERLMDMGIIEHNSRALIEFAIQRLRYSKANGRSANMTSELPVAVNQDGLPEYS
ncbi:hypothetical protein BC829DRAFT_429774 [Chytridium lagenaria]|nr:hypothetical protein BC829DRAFT_429774 [Chytridium lagenaria]